MVSRVEILCVFNLLSFSVNLVRCLNFRATSSIFVEWVHNLVDMEIQLDILDWTERD
jgi:hypothetical protein